MTDLTDTTDPHARKAPAGPTPGPWRTLGAGEDHPDYAGAVVLGADGSLVADANIFGNPGRSDAENEANARLIAAAPDLAAERDKLAAFKKYVHDRLDAAGVPADPESPHKAEGCRIGGRLDCVLGERADVARLVEALRYYADPVHWAGNGACREILATDGGASQSFDHGRHARVALARHGKAGPAAATDPSPELPEDADGAPLPTVEMIAAAFSETIFWNNCMPWPDDQGDHWPLESIRPVPPAYRPKVGQIWDGDAATLLRFIDGECSVDVAILPPQVDDSDNGSVTSEADADFVAKLPVYVPILLAEIDRLRAKAAR